MEVLKTGYNIENTNHATFDEAACCRRLHCWLHQWSWYRLLSGVNHVPTRKFCESVCENKSVKITRSEMHVYLWCSYYLENTYRLHGGGRGGDSASGVTLHGAVFGRAPPHPLVSLADHRLYFSSSSIPVKEIIPVYSHLGTHAMSVVNSSGSKIVTVTYERTEAFI